jgi:hypothetical protein
MTTTHDKVMEMSGQNRKKLFLIHKFPLLLSQKKLIQEEKSETKNLSRQNSPGTFIPMFVSHPEMSYCEISKEMSLYFGLDIFC